MGDFFKFYLKHFYFSRGFLIQKLKRYDEIEYIFKYLRRYCTGVNDIFFELRNNCGVFNRDQLT